MTLVDQEVEKELRKVISTVSREKGLDKAVIVDALEQAIIHAARRTHGAETDLEAHYNEEQDEVELFQFRTVVEEVADKALEIAFPEAQVLDPESVIGDSLGVKIETSKFGRIAAQSAKQIIVQKVRDAERAQIYEEFKDRVGEIMSGQIKRIERNDLIIDLGRTEAIMPYREQVPTERWRVKDRVSGYVLEVKRASRGPQVVMSRAHSGFLQRLFEQNVSEIYDGIVSIEAAARDPGARSKIAVYSRDSSVDPVGACVGMKGARVQAVVQELNGEKIDIIPWDRDPARLVCNALAPAVVSKVIVDDERHSMEVIVGDDQLSLAIGKRGQNVRLAAQLTGWRLDIKSESKLQEQSAGAKEIIAGIGGLGLMRAGILVNEGIKTALEISKISPRTLVRLLNVDVPEAEVIIEAARTLAEEQGHKTTDAATAEDAEAGDGAASTALTAAASAQNERVKVFLKLSGVGEATAHALAEAGYGTIGDVIADSAEEVAQKTGLSIGIARTVQMAADRYLQSEMKDSE